MHRTQGSCLAEDCETILQHVTQVPPIKDGVIRKICADYFGLYPERIERLNGYDDKNYKLSNVTRLYTNSNLTTLCADGYVMKITNVEDSSVKDLIEGQNALMRHLKAKGLPAPELVRSKDGSDLARVFVDYATNDEGNTAGAIHAIRILHFIPGQLLYHVPANSKIFFKVGRLLAEAHNALEDFRHLSFGNIPTTPWSLYNFHFVKELLHTIEDEQRRQMITDIMDSFKEKVVPRMHSLQTGQIHGDINEQNLLVRQDKAGDFDVCGLLDMGDSHRTCLIFDVAIAIVYMMMLDAETVPLKEVGGHFLAGYTTKRRIPTEELHLLRLCMCARYSQSLTFGLFAYMQNPTPENDYVLFTQNRGWPQLATLWRASEAELYDYWRRVLSMYGMSSVL